MNPVDYIATALRAILDGHPQSGIEDLMPWRFNQPSSLAAQGHAAAPATSRTKENVTSTANALRSFGYPWSEAAPCA